MIQRKFLALLMSYLAAVIFVAFYVLLYIRSNGSIHIDIILLASVVAMILTIPYGIMDFLDMRIYYEAERRVADFLRDIAEYTTFGMPISEAIVRTADIDYGPLSKEVKRVATLISWGIPVEIALSRFGTEINSPNIIRAGKLILKAAESGSNISDVMNLVSDFTTQMQLMRNSRFTEMKSYTMVMMISFGVFLFVVLVIDALFLPKISAHGFASFGMSVTKQQIQSIKNVFNIGMVVQGGGTGILSGVLRDGRISSGVLLSGILIFISSIVLIITGSI